MTDTVANLRVDQAWGGAQVMGALHEVNASYYRPHGGWCAERGRRVGNPSDKWGWAAGVGLKINTPFISQGDWFQTQVNVTQGALRYLFNTPNTNYGMAQAPTEASATKATACSPTACTVVRVWGVGFANGLPADLGLGHQRRLRALLDPGVAHFVVRRLLLRCRMARVPARPTPCCARRRAPATARAGHGSCCDGRLQQQLVDLGRRLAHAVGCHQDVLPGRRGAVPELRSAQSFNNLVPAGNAFGGADGARQRQQLDGQRSRSPRLPALIA